MEGSHELQEDARKLRLVVVDWRDVAVDFDIDDFAFLQPTGVAEISTHSCAILYTVFAVCAVKPPAMSCAWG